MKAYHMERKIVQFPILVQNIYIKKLPAHSIEMIMSDRYPARGLACRIFFQSDLLYVYYCTNLFYPMNLFLNIYEKTRKLTEINRMELEGYTVKHITRFCSDSKQEI